jgi:hypothetical protein
MRAETGVLHCIPELSRGGQPSERSSTVSPGIVWNPRQATSALGCRTIPHEHLRCAP